jgi:hypothetical protein
LRLRLTNFKWREVIEQSLKRWINFETTLEDKHDLPNLLLEVTQVLLLLLLLLRSTGLQGGEEISLKSILAEDDMMSTSALVQVMYKQDPNIFCTSLAALLAAA